MEVSLRVASGQKNLHQYCVNRDIEISRGGPGGDGSPELHRLHSLTPAPGPALTRLTSCTNGIKTSRLRGATSCHLPARVAVSGGEGSQKSATIA